MSIIVLQYIFAAGNTIIASQHNTNNSTIYNMFNGGIDTTNISPTAGIQYSQLNVTGSITNNDISTSAAIANSKLNLSSISQNVVHAGSLTTSGNFIIGTEHQGDIFYDNGTSLVRLTPGISGQYLQTLGNGANPQWVTLSSIPRTLIGIWQDNTGVTCSNGAGAQVNYNVIDNATDWAGKYIMIIGTVEQEQSDSFSGTLPSIVNTSATALSNMNYLANHKTFIINGLLLPTNSYTSLLTYTDGFSNIYGVGIGTNSSGNLCSVSFGTWASGSTYHVYTQITGAIIRNP